jgi:hypothetical protein
MSASTNVDSTFVVIEMSDIKTIGTQITGDAPEKTHTVDVENVDKESTVVDVENADKENQKRIARKTLFIGVFVIVLIVIAFAIWRTVVIFG